MRMGLVVKVVVLVVLSLSIVASVWAQSGSTTGSIIGTVTDSQGLVLPETAITIRELKTNLTRTLVTDEKGAYRIIQLTPGRYQLTVTATGFQPEKANIDVQLGVTTLTQFVLRVSDVNDVVEVTAATLVDQRKTENSTNIDRGRIDNLPINRRNFLDFTLITPGVVRDRVPAQGVGLSSGLSFNGQPARGNNITIDGLDNNDIGLGAVRSTYSQDAVQEFQVVGDSYSAEFGRAIGGVVNIVTRGGGNEYHGNLFFFNRNDETSARDVFSASEPNYKQYQFGTTLHGPIKKDKIFFFSSFERLSIKQSNIVTLSDQTVSSARRLGFNINNGPVPFALNTTSLLGRLDTRFSPQDTLYLRYNFGGTYNGALEPFGGLVGETNGGILTLEDNTFAASNLYINSGLNLINETRFLYARRNQDIVSIGDEPQVNIVAPEGLAVFGREVILPQPRLGSTYQFVDNVTLTRGRHEIKFGGDLLYFKLGDRTRQPLFAGGFAVFLPINFSALSGIPGLPSFGAPEAFDPGLRTPEQRSFLVLLSSLLPSMSPGFPRNLPLVDLSLPVVYVQGFGDPRVSFNQKLFSLFLQDDIKVSPNLLVKVGGRYDLTRASFMPKNNGNFSPRIAVSYRPARFSNLNLRAAYGVFFSTPLSALSAIIDLTSISKAVQVAVLPFPFSILPFSMPGHRFPQSNAVPSDIPLRQQFSQVFTYEPNLRNSYTQQVRAGFDYLFSRKTQLSLSYGYVRGNKLVSVRNINPVVRPIPGNPLDSQLTGRRLPDQGEIFEFASAYDSYYHSLTATLAQRFTDQFNILAHYTLSKTIDNFIDIVPTIQEAQDPLNIANERGLSLQDVRHRFVFSGIWDLNYARLSFLRGFQISTILNVESGKPFNLLAGTDLNMSSDNPPGDRPAGIGRNAGITPGFANLDLRLTRTVTIKERFSLQGIFEVFNLFNRVNISEIDRIYPPDQQGRFSLPRQENGRFIATRDRFRNAFAPRQIQFGFRLSF
ncbi:MAG: TonB-dependent receptor [Acidobacteriota bacterium]